MYTLAVTIAIISYLILGKVVPTQPASSHRSVVSCCQADIWMRSLGLLPYSELLTSLEQVVIIL